MTHSMRKSSGESGDIFTVGIWTGSGWNAVMDFDNAPDAGAFCNYLNGGDGHTFHAPSEATPQVVPLPVPEDPPPEVHDELPTDEPEPWELEPRPSISAQRKGAPKRPKR